MPDDIKQSGGNDNVEGILDNLNSAVDLEDDDKEPELKLKEIPDEEDDDQDDDKEDDKEGKEKDEKDKEDKLDLQDEEDEDELDINIPTRQELLNAYPDIKEKFPGFDKVIFREGQYTQIFPTIDDAKNAAARLETFNNIERDVFNGNIENLLIAVKQNNDKAFGHISENLFDTFAKIDQVGYLKAASGLLKNTLQGIYDKGTKLGTDDGKQQALAARYVHAAIFGESNITVPPAKQQEQVNPESQKLNQERHQFEMERQHTAVMEVTTRASKTIRSAVEKIIDTKGSMSSYVRSKAVDDVVKLLDKNLEGDARFRASVDRLWRDSQSKGFNEESKKAIRHKILKTANSVLPYLVRKVRADALKGNSSRGTHKEEKERFVPTKEQRQAPSNNNRSNDKPKMRGNSVDSIMAELNRL